MEPPPLVAPSLHQASNTEHSYECYCGSCTIMELKFILGVKLKILKRKIYSQHTKRERERERERESIIKYTIGIHFFNQCLAFFFYCLWVPCQFMLYLAYSPIFRWDPLLQPMFGIFLLLFVGTMLVYALFGLLTYI